MQTKAPVKPTPTLARRHLVALAALGLLAGALPCAAAPRASAPPQQGVVTQVSDGRTLAVALPGQPLLTLRLRDIEPPEPCQPGATEARQALSDLALNRPAIVQGAGRDAQGLLIAAVRVDEFDLGRRMVEEGYAWSTRSKWDRGPLVKEERMAQTLRRGLHAHPDTLSPADYRRHHGPCAGAPSAPKAKGR
jgi:endonuclease YncB( thermonuclease family)